MKNENKDVIILILTLLVMIFFFPTISSYHTGLVIGNEEFFTEDHPGYLEIIYECWNDNGNGTYTSFLGYNNDNIEEEILVGNNNKINKMPHDSNCKITNGKIDCNQPTYFYLGRQYKVSNFIWDGDGDVVWRVKYYDIILKKWKTKTATISINPEKECIHDCIDEDLDGWNTTLECNDPIDCDDNNADINPNSNEICNNIDDNCNSFVDENLIQACGSDIGECIKGIQNCNLGMWEECSGDYVGPVNEICDGLDNNCDSIIDEGFDNDNDTISDCFDNCNETYNPNQLDSDMDGIGDECDAIIDSRIIEMQFNSTTKKIILDITTNINLSNISMNINKINDTILENSIEILSEKNIDENITSASIKFYYNKTKLNELDLNESNLIIKYYFNDSWIDMNTTIDYENNYSFVNINELNKFGLFFEKNSHNIQSPPQPSGRKEKETEVIAEETVMIAEEKPIVEEEPKVNDETRILEKEENKCDDNIKNGDETGIDCGGSCNPCKKSIFNNVTNFFNYILFFLLLLGLTSLLKLNN